MTVRFDCRHSYNHGFSLDVAFEGGEGVTGICGPSGSGKTTILMLMAGLLRPSDGVIILDNRVLVDTARRTWVPPHLRGVGMVFQDGLLFPHMTVRDNLRFGQSRRPARTIEFERVVEALAIADLLERYPSTLSGGQARRVAIGRALLRGPRMLMLDEPWSGLEEPLRDQVSTLVRQCIEKWRIPTLLVGHDQAFIQSMADRVILIQAGRLRS